MEPTGRKVLIYALPLAFLLAFGASHFPLAAIPLFVATTQIHEFGHAFMAWLSGRRALPLFIGWTNINPERSLFVFACLAFLIGLTIWKCWQHRAWYLAGVCVVLLLFQVYFTFRLDAEEFEALTAWGGVGGEFWISAILIIAFYFKMPDGMRWDFFRYIALFIGACTFFRSYLLWFQVSHGQASVPWGSLWGGESNGDMNRLVGDFGWPERELIRSYVRMANCCLLGIVGTYLAFLVKSFQPRPEQATAAEPEIRRRPFKPPGDPQPTPPLRLRPNVYVYVNDAVSGPIDSSQLPAMVSDGTVQMETPCCIEGTENWRAVGDFV